jgi:hypothetical protein
MHACMHTYRDVTYTHSHAHAPDTHTHALRCERRCHSRTRQPRGASASSTHHPVCLRSIFTALTFVCVCVCVCVYMSSKVRRAVKQAYAELRHYSHPDKYILPWMPGGSLFMRNPPLPFEVSPHAHTHAHTRACTRRACVQGRGRGCPRGSVAQVRNACPHLIGCHSVVEADTCGHAGCAGLRTDVHAYMCMCVYVCACVFLCVCVCVRVCVCVPPQVDSVNKDYF